uniref:Rho-GAP domain-containing protein n=1 Tax=Mesocestoides corti TaxID=53468 RepID=A0A5K3F446_MESCO
LFPRISARSQLFVFAQIDRQKAVTESNSAAVVEADDRVATHPADQLSSSSCESLSSLSSKSPPRKWEPTESVEATEDDRALEASLRWAELQAALEAFKARHPTPLQNVTASTQDLEAFSRELLCHYTNELEAQINTASEQLVASLAEREELRLFREALDDFIILHNAVQLRRRQAAEAVLANATRFTSVHLSHQQPTMYRRTPHSYAAGSLIELADFSGKKSTPLSGSAVSLNLHSQEGTRMPRGHHLGDPIEFPGLRSALSRLSGLRFGQPAGLRIADDEVKFAARVVADVDKYRSQVTDSRVTKRLASVARERGSKLPSLSLPWPMGRPECSQTLKLRIPIPSSDLTTWFSPRICKMNQVLLSALQESPTLNKLLNELMQFVPAKTLTCVQLTKFMWIFLALFEEPF